MGKKVGAIKTDEARAIFQEEKTTLRSFRTISAVDWCLAELQIFLVLGWRTETNPEIPEIRAFSRKRYQP